MAIDDQGDAGYPSRWPPNTIRLKHSLQRFGYPGDRPLVLEIAEHRPSGGACLDAGLEDMRHLTDYDAKAGIDDSPNLSLPIRSGASRLMQSLFELALMEGPALTHLQRSDFGRMIVRSIANALLEAPELDGRQAKMR